MMSSRPRAATSPLLLWLAALAALAIDPHLHPHSVGTALLWFHLFLAVLLGLMGRKGSILLFGLTPLLTGTGAALLRLALPLDLGWAIVIESRILLPALQKILGWEVLHLNGTPVQLLALLLPLWMMGSVILLLRFLQKWLQTARWVRTLPLSDDQHLHGLVRRVTGQDIPIRYTDGGSPAIYGLIRPVLLLPDYPYTDAQLDRILRHEWQHRTGGDVWIKLLLELLCILLWWSPLVWLLRRKSRHVLELRCDFGVLRGLTEAERLDYYDTILQTARMAKGHTSSPYLSMLAAPPLVERFEVGLDYAAIARRSEVRARLLCLAILLCFALSYIVVFRSGVPLWN